MNSTQLKYSIIIPVLNDEYFLKRNFIHLKKFKRKFEILVADGGSRDKTAAVCKEFGILKIESPPARGMQLNSGAQNSSGDILIFLHADSFLPDNAFELLDSFFENPVNQICRFRLKFDISHRMLKIYEFLSRYNSRFTRFGDMGIIVRRSFFDQIGGFQDHPIFEDVDFFKRAEKFTNIHTFDSEMITSARKFIAEGILRNQLRNIKLFTKYLTGVDTGKLAAQYFSKQIKNKTALIIFARFPEPGSVKTRITANTNDEFACDLYNEIASYLFKEIRSLNKMNKFVFYSEKRDFKRIAKWAGKKFFFAPQKGKDLGERMKNACELVFSASAQKAIIIGTDIPEIRRSHVIEAEHLLEENDVAIGPAYDGGYYLLGIKRMHGSLFANIEWSAAEVFEQTIKIAESQNLKAAKLPALQDIDTKDDLYKWLAETQNRKLKKRIEKLIWKYNL